MPSKKLFLAALAAGFVFSAVFTSFAQDAMQTSATAQASPDPQQQPEEKAKLERKATVLLEQVISEAQALKLPQNRIRVQIAAGAMLWDKNQGRARDQFTNAGAAVAQMISEADRGDRDEMQTVNQLRQELVLTAARKDADLAYQLLHSTESQTPNTNPRNGRRVIDQSSALEASLLSIVAATDPKYAYQKAVESLDKNEYPTAVGRVLAQLQAKDKESFDKLSTKVLSKLTPDSLSASRDAGNMALGLLRPGPRPDQPAPDSSSAANTSTNATNNAPVSNQVLSVSAYHDLMDATISAALNAQRVNPGSMGNVTVLSGGNGGPGIGRGFRGPQVVPSNPPDEAQVQQNNTRALLVNLQMMLPQIDQYVPERSQAVRQKLSELGMNNNMMNSVGQMANAMRQNTSEALMNAASTAPPQIQSRLYQQAAQRAIDEGNTDRAAQIATDHLDEASRNSIMQAVDFKRAIVNMSADKLNEIRLKLAALPSDSDRVKYLLDLSTALQKDNPKLALRFLDDARGLVSKKAAGYNDFEDQLKVAAAYASVDPKRSFDVLEPGIAQLNELLSAAQVLNGFEVEVFRDGELPIRGGSELGGMVARYGDQLAALAKLDFDHARMTADRFQLPEPRLLTKLSIVQGIFGVQPINDNNRRPQNFNFNFAFGPQ